MKNKIVVTIMMAIMLLALSMTALAIPTVEYVKINDDIHESGDNLIVERGETLEIKVKLQANNSEDNIVVEADILGYEHGDTSPISDNAPTFDMEAGDTDYKTLTLEIPTNADRDYYDLRVRVAGRTGSAFEGTYRLHLQGLRHQIIIKDILVDQEVLAGRGIFVNAKIQNIGEKTEDDITVKISIPDLGLVQYTTIEELDADDSITTEDVVLLIPECAKSGDYEIEVEIDYNDEDEVKSTTEITVLKNDVCEATGGQTGTQTDKTVINVPQAQEAKAGDSAVFPIMITNLGATSKTYTITVSPTVDSFATYTIDPSNVVIVKGGETRTVYVYTALKKDAQTGLKDFVVTVKTGSESQNIPLSVNILKGEKTTDNQGLKTALEIGLIVLLIILIIVGLVWGFNKIKASGNEEKNEEVNQTYY